MAGTDTPSGRRRRRSARDWVVDTLVFVFAVLSGFLLYEDGHHDPIPPELLAFDFVAGMAVCLTLFYLATADWGLYIRSRRQLVQTLRDRADRAETVARLQAQQAQMRAREEIAREMHDVLDHRLSLLSVHAGALAYRPDATTTEVAGAAEIIRASAHQALQDLRE